MFDRLSPQFATSFITKRFSKYPRFASSLKFKHPTRLVGSNFARNLPMPSGVVRAAVAGASRQVQAVCEAVIPSPPSRSLHGDGIIPTRRRTLTPSRRLFGVIFSMIDLQAVLAKLTSRSRPCLIILSCYCGTALTSGQFCGAACLAVNRIPAHPESLNMSPNLSRKRRALQARMTINSLLRAVGWILHPAWSADSLSL